MLQRGLLTRAEFDQQKRIILSQSGSGTGRASLGAQPTSVGAYAILGVIGHGGMGTVYRARHRTPTRAETQGGDVALKVMHPALGRQPDFRARFEREASLGLRLVHPNLVRVFDLLVDGDTLGLVMELIEGRPLSTIIGHEVGPMSWMKARPLFRQLLSGVGYAHDKGVIHRDLKPDNVLVTPDGVLKIIDFGIARDGQGTTKTGVMGTVDYMAPEQYTNPSAVDHRADIYALGMTLYEMLAGRLPWEQSANEFTVMKLKSEGTLPSASAFYPYIPSGVLDAADKALAVEPRARFRSASDFLRALEGATTDPTRQADSPPIEGFQELPAAARAPDWIDAPEAETIRRAHIQHEASIKSVGTLYSIGAVLIGISAAGVPLVSCFDTSTGEAIFGLMLGGLFAGLAVQSFRVGEGLKRLDRKVRVWGTVLALFLIFAYFSIGIYVIFLPVGVIGIYVISLLNSSKAARIFAEDYADIVKQTPHVTGRSSQVLLGILAAMVGFFGLMLLAAMFAAVL
jgi:serine/threonine protein kinase